MTGAPRASSTTGMAGNGAPVISSTASGGRLWSLSGMVIGDFVPADAQARAAALRLAAIGLLLALTLALRPRGLIGEDLAISRHAGNKAAGP